MTWTSVAKPSSTPYTNTNPGGKEQYDQSGIAYDSSITFYDGINPNQWTKNSKPTTPSWTKVNKPLGFQVIDTFDTYSLGAINGQGGWTESGGTFFTIENSVVYQGTKAVQAPSDCNTGINRNIPPIVGNGLMSTYFRQTLNDAETTPFQINDSNGNFVAFILSSPNYVISTMYFVIVTLYGNALIAPVSFNTWQRIGIEINNGFVRGFVDGVYSSSVQTAGIDMKTVIMSTNLPSATPGTLYWDYVTFNPL